VRRIVITGLGALTPLGNDPETLFDGLLVGRSGVAPVAAFSAGDVRPAYAAEVNDLGFDGLGVPRKKLKMMGRNAQLALAAALNAWVDSRLNESAPLLDRNHAGVVLGTGMLNADAVGLGHACAAAGTAPGALFDMKPFATAFAREMFPLWLLRHIPNLVSAHTTMVLDLRGPSNTITTGWTASANAVGEAMRLVERGEADVMLAGGADARVSPLATLRYRDLGWLSTRGDVDPIDVAAPFDRAASGFVNAEGASVLVLEEIDHARDRRARVYAEVAGYGAANDAYDILVPHPEGRGLARAVRRCLASAGCPPDRVDAVFAPGFGIPSFDAAAAKALEHVFDGAAPRPALTATAGALGNTHAAAAAIDCVAAALATIRGEVPPTRNLREPITELDFVHGASRETPIETALVASYGFGGHAAAILLRRWDA
jgi:3-oxoacyl-[acyl-carrier-protein] synthase II